jgi:hypothetical protein
VMVAHTCSTGAAMVISCSMRLVSIRGHPFSMCNGRLRAKKGCATRWLLYVVLRYAVIDCGAPVTGAFQSIR